MKHLSHKEFEQRWNAARVRPELKAKPVAAATAPRIELSLETILDNYEKRVQQALQAHAIGKADCDGLCKDIAALKSRVAALDDKLKPFTNS
ncbi:hypothetical protein [Marinobacter sp. SS21]|uniref:hypothetical protein n=1 Tax=Marinobacter sp. SS21 TaxID=2979460 RepID=UPI00232BA7C7|nr:hypothetical protein [Marinobacter sp. SS21]MDC0661502.1 hypothetical protein [Marinobacter sp. SS21]